MDEHRWKVNGRDARADRAGIYYQTKPDGDLEMILGGSICNEEILRLSAIENEAARLRLELEEVEGAREDDAEVRSVLFTAGQQAAAREEEALRESALLRRERSLLIELEKVRCGIIGAVAEGREVDSQLFRSVGELNDAMAALHLEASGGVQRPPGVPCACVLCRPAAHTGAPGKSVETRAETDRS